MSFKTPTLEFTAVFIALRRQKIDKYWNQITALFSVSVVWIIDWEATAINQKCHEDISWAIFYYGCWISKSFDPDYRIRMNSRSLLDWACKDGLRSMYFAKLQNAIHTCADNAMKQRNRCCPSPRAHASMLFLPFLVYLHGYACKVDSIYQIEMASKIKPPISSFQKIGRSNKLWIRKDCLRHMEKIINFSLCIAKFCPVANL